MIIYCRKKDITISDNSIIYLFVQFQQWMIVEFDDDVELFDVVIIVAIGVVVAIDAMETFLRTRSRTLYCTSTCNTFGVLILYEIYVIWYLYLVDCLILIENLSRRIGTN